MRITDEDICKAYRALRTSRDLRAAMREWLLAEVILDGHVYDMATEALRPLGLEVVDDRYEQDYSRVSRVRYDVVIGYKDDPERDAHALDMFADCDEQISLMLDVDDDTIGAMQLTYVAG